jgi:hypothetical protein
MTRRYGRASHGERVREGAPAGHWRTLTLLGAITLDGLLAMMTIESPTDGDVFLAYLEQVLCPRLRPQQIVVMDNLSAHKHPQVRTLIEQTGAQLLFICCPTRPTSTPSSSAGPRSKNTYGEPRRVSSTPSNKPSLQPSPPSPLRTRLRGFTTPVIQIQLFWNCSDME